MLALTSRYHTKSTLTAWSSGTGFAGVFGYVAPSVSPTCSGATRHGQSSANAQAMTGMQRVRSLLRCNCRYAWVTVLHAMLGIELSTVVLAANILVVLWLVTFHIHLRPPATAVEMAAGDGGVGAANDGVGAIHGDADGGGDDDTDTDTDADADGSGYVVGHSAIAAGRAGSASARSSGADELDASE